MTESPELLPALKARSPEAFQQLFEIYSDKMFRLAVGMLGDEQEAEDVVQEAFLRLFERINTFEGRSKVGTWLYRTVHNASVDRLRKRKPGLEINSISLAGDSPLPLPAVFVDWKAVPEAQLNQAEVQDQLEAAAASLPESLRTVFLLRDVEELSTEEVAGILEISSGAVKVRLHRARLQLRERLAHYFAEKV